MRRGRSAAKQRELCVSDVLVRARPRYDRVVGGWSKARVAAAFAFAATSAVGVAGCVTGGAPTTTMPSKSAVASVESSKSAPTSSHGVAQISLADEKSCARLVDGRIECWGLLDPDQDRSVTAPTPMGSFGGANGADGEGAIDFAVGADHGCALLANGRLRCWGANSDGELGDGTHNAAPFATAEPALDDVRSVAVGVHFTCARQKSGIVTCWGRNDHAQLADGTTTSKSVPTVSPSLVGIGSFALGRDDGVAIDADGALTLWGGPTSASPLKLQPPPLTVLAPTPKVVQVAVSVTHACALLDDGTVRCWGTNDEGELGDGTDVSRATPEPVVGLQRVVQISVGRGTSCARIADGTARCWGHDHYGQLGDGLTKDESLPTPVAGLTRCKQIAIAYGHACALIDDGTMQCWGSNASGELGDGTRKNRQVRGPVVW
jgi:alpha-tubulin suppressor-like RCC1 family protein